MKDAALVIRDKNNSTIAPLIHAMCLAVLTLASVTSDKSYAGEPGLECRMFYSQAITESETRPNSARKSLESVLGINPPDFVTLVVERLAGCHLLLVESDLENPILQPRIWLVQVKRDRTYLIAKGRMPSDDSRSAGSTRFARVIAHGFQNAQRVLRINEDYFRAGGGFGVSSYSSYYVMQNGRRLSVILQALDYGSSGYNLGGGCYSESESRGKLALLSKKTQGWPDVEQTIIEYEQEECQPENSQTSRSSIKSSSGETRRTLRWNGLVYQQVGDTRIAKHANPMRPPPVEDESPSYFGLDLSLPTYEQVLASAPQLRKEDDYLNDAFSFLSAGYDCPSGGINGCYICGMPIDRFTAFREEQRRWLNLREKHALAAGPPGSEAYAATMIKLTAERNNMLEGLIDRLVKKGDPRCNNFVPAR